MACRRLKDPKLARDSLNAAIEMSAHILRAETELVEFLYWIDRRRYYVNSGSNSLRGFLQFRCGFTGTQAQRLATRVRRHMPTSNFWEEQGVTSPRTLRELMTRRP